MGEFFCLKPARGSEEVKVRSSGGGGDCNFPALFRAWMGKVSSI